MTSPSLQPLEPRRLLASVPAGFADEVFANGLSSPTAFAFAPDGRLFVTEQGGAVRIVKNGQLLPTPFLTRDVNSDGERGLLGITFDPNFSSNHFVYCYYTTPSGAIHNRVSRFIADGDVIEPGSEQVIFDLDPLSGATNHNGGAIHFGPGGKLYIAAGENATPSKSQSLKTVLGKVLRINADGSIPSDNPFFKKTTGKNRAIYVRGLRNPFTFAFQQGTGKLFINDVGQNTFEEINVGIAGANYGWPSEEGKSSNPKFKSPLFTYNHNLGCAITGGTFYDPAVANLPASFEGDYFFSDYCGGWIHRYDISAKRSRNFAEGIGAPVDLTVGPDGALYYLAYDDGQVGRISANDTSAPTITDAPDDATASIGQVAHFSASVSGDGVTLQWQRNQQDIPGATSATLDFGPVDLTNDGDEFRLIAHNAGGDAPSTSAVLHVLNNHIPLPVIDSPAAGGFYTGGQTIQFSGSATDDEDGALDASHLSWTVLFHHNQHTHPVLGPQAGVSSGSFDIPQTGETSANVFYRITLTATDADGASASTFVDVDPTLVSFKLASLPRGLTLLLDGQPIKTSANVPGVSGIRRTLAAPSTQVFKGKTYRFVRWADGGKRVRAVTTPGQTTTYKAIYEVVSASVSPKGPISPAPGPITPISPAPTTPVFGAPTPIFGGGGSILE